MSIALSDDLSSLATSDGTCRYFDAANHACSIYEDRPRACNIWRTYRDDPAYDGASWDDFVYTNMLSCCALRYLNDIPEPDGSPFIGRQEEIALAVLGDAAGDDGGMSGDEGVSSGAGGSEAARERLVAPGEGDAIGRKPLPEISGASRGSDDGDTGKNEDTQAPYQMTGEPARTARSSKLDALRDANQPLVGAAIDLDVPQIGAVQAGGGKHPAGNKKRAAGMRRRSRKVTHERGELLD